RSVSCSPDSSASLPSPLPHSPAVIAFLPFSPARPHRALPSFPTRRSSDLAPAALAHDPPFGVEGVGGHPGIVVDRAEERGDPVRSEEHTSELQSRFDLVCRLLLEKKKSPCAPGEGPGRRRPWPRGARGNHP